jgi:hypothetical protein
MSHSNRNHRERKTARAIAAAQGISYQRALQRLRARKGAPNVAAERRVRGLLKSIERDRWLHLRVPHGFRTDVISSEQRPNVFTDVIGHVRVDVVLTVPVVYDAKNGWAHKATRSNLHGLRAWIEERAAEIGLELVGWTVKPDDDPQPKGDPDGRDQRWSVVVSFDDRDSYEPRALDATAS